MEEGKPPPRPDSLIGAHRGRANVPHGGHADVRSADARDRMSSNRIIPSPGTGRTRMVAALDGGETLSIQFCFDATSTKYE
jgi:hypothetical protein